MPQASTSRVQLYYGVESVAWGTQATGNYDTARFTGETLAHQKATVESAEIRSDRQIPYLAEVGAGAGGDVNFELSFLAYDTWLQSLLASTWVEQAASSTQGQKSYTSAVFAAAGKTITLTGIGASLVAGQYIRISGTTSGTNDGFFLIASVTANEITVVETLVDQTSNCVLSASRIVNGTTDKSFTFQKAFEDITTNEYAILTGMEASAMRLNITADQIVGGAFTFLGEEVTLADSSIAGTPVAAAANPLFNATSNVGGVYETYSIPSRVLLTTALQSISINIDGQLRQRRAIASRGSVGIGTGRYRVTGNVNAYFESGTLYNKMIQHTATSLAIFLHDVPGTEAQKITGNTYIITLPYVFFSSGDPQAPASDQDVFANLAYQAVRDPTTGITVQIDRFAET